MNDISGVPSSEQKIEDFDKTARNLVRDHVLRLTYTAHDMAPFARDLGYEGPPFVWNEEERRHRRARRGKDAAALPFTFRIGRAIASLRCRNMRPHTRRGKDAVALPFSFRRCPTKKGGLKLTQLSYRKFVPHEHFSKLRGNCRRLRNRVADMVRHHFCPPRVTLRRTADTIGAFCVRARRTW